MTWVQEEPVNQGAFQFAKLHLEPIMSNLELTQTRIGYVGRSSCHSFATGAGTDNKKENESLWNQFAERLQI